MSLVGTRPPTLDEWEKYEPHHRARMSFRPGLTGLWQVSGRSNITDFEEVVKLDTVSFTAVASGADNYTIGIDKTGVGRVVTEGCGSTYTISADRLGAGEYSAWMMHFISDRQIPKLLS